MKYSKNLFLMLLLNQYHFQNYFCVTILSSPLPDPEKFDPLPSKNSSPASENFLFLPKIPKFLSHPQCRVGKTLCVHFLIISIGVVYPINLARVLYFFEIGQAGGFDKTLESWSGWASWWKTFSGEVEHI